MRRHASVDCLGLRVPAAAPAAAATNEPSPADRSSRPLSHSPFAAGGFLDFGRSVIGTPVPGMDFRAVPVLS
jgi:hypothetical protein